MSADGNTLISGGYLDNSQIGASWIWTRTGTTWTQQGSKLIGTGAVGAARQTSNEQNANRFEVERSIDGISFDNISIVEANNGGSIHNYQVTDNAPWTSDLRYYRLKSVDNNGNFTYSRIITISNSQNTATIVYPNPVKDKFVISVPDNKLLER